MTDGEAIERVFHPHPPEYRHARSGKGWVLPMLSGKAACAWVRSRFAPLPAAVRVGALMVSGRGTSEAALMRGSDPLRGIEQGTMKKLKEEG